MSQIKQLKLWVMLGLVLCLGLSLTSCATSTASAEPFFGVTEPPPGQVMRYVNGAEPTTLDPQIPDGQPEARIAMALFEGLVEYDPKTLKPIPAIAERWESNKELTEYTFHLRKTARWSDGTPINAQDFVYSLRRGLSPTTGSKTAGLAYYVKYAQAYNEGAVFVRDSANGKFLLKKDFLRSADLAAPEATPTPEDQSEDAARVARERREAAKKEEQAKKDETASKPTESEFHKFINDEARLTVAADEAERVKAAKANPKLQRELAGKEFVPVKAEDIGIEAVDDFTVRITLQQSAPFFLASLPHQLFRLVPRQVIEKLEDKRKHEWTKPENIVTNGPFKVKEWLPYNRLVLVKNENYWDAERVKLNRLEFYPLEELTTIMNLYKTGNTDAFLNHGVPSAWLGEISQYKDFMKLPEAANTFVKINTTHPPFDKTEVRKAFNQAIDKVAYANWRRTVLPSYAFVPEGIFADYPSPVGDKFNPQEAKKLLASAGYRDTLGNFDAAQFPANQVEFLYNSGETNKAVAEFLQAQWKQNLGIEIPLRAMEWTALQDATGKLAYKGFSLGGWGADYMDPNTFLELFSSKDAGGNSGWYDPAYKQLLDDANKQLDAKKRLELLARAEAYLLNAQPFISLSTASTNFMKKPYVKGFYPNPQSLYAWKFVYLEYDPTKWDQGPPKMTE